MGKVRVTESGAVQERRGKAGKALSLSYKVGYPPGC